jgi:hypothetical protein
MYPCRPPDTGHFSAVMFSLLGFVHSCTVHRACSFCSVVPPHNTNHFGSHMWEWIMMKSFHHLVLQCWHGSIIHHKGHAKFSNRFSVMPFCVWAGKRSRYSEWLWAGRSGDRIPVGARFSTPVQTGPGVHPASCTVDTGSFLGVKSSQGVTLTPYPLLVPWSRKGRAIPLLPLWAVQPVQSLGACTRVHFIFTILCDPVVLKDKQGDLNITISRI